MKKIFITFIALFPVISFAQNNKTLKDIAALVIDYLNIAIYLIIGLAIITFIWNVYLYFFTEKDKKEAGKYVLYSVIGFFVILSFWGLVAILRNSLKLNDRAPSFPGFSQGGTYSGYVNSNQTGNYYQGSSLFNTNNSNYNPPTPLPGANSQTNPSALPGANGR